MSKVLVIGDVHGCLDEFQELVRLAGPVDAYISIGDLIDRGPDTLGCLAFWDSLKTSHPDSVLIRGNHDDKFLRFTERSKEFTKTGRMAMHPPMHEWMHAVYPGTEEVVSCAIVTEEGKEAFRILSDSVFSLRLGRFIFIHGGIPAGKSWVEWPASFKRVKSVMFCRHLDHLTGETLTLGDATPEDPYWANIYDGRFGHAIFGHQVHLFDQSRYPHATAIDHGCCFGLFLTGLVLDTEKGDVLNEIHVECMHKEMAADLDQRTSVGE